jgi:hypothetical protein
MTESPPVRERRLPVRVVSFILLFLGGLLIAGTYGALHNQISFTVAPEYFTVFKFQQFGIPSSMPRLGASVVGFLASWWMGACIGLPVVGLGFFQPTVRLQVVRTLQAYGICAATALLVGLGALGVAFLTEDGSNIPPYFTEMGVTDPSAFMRAGTMHDFSYLDGLLGIVTGVAFQLTSALRSRRQLRLAASEVD